ncbi:response regulator [Alteromonas halophila]|uniref:DNA-binding response regulator n=1 Tax=Alteromonas halophila TaxID=516698 RepID=A0A918JGI9_9ALTE|nr:response regulator [Alteromonas halophila]GGW78977.1 DNA-binding response regulator [Alteromonas halophila]
MQSLLIIDDDHQLTAMLDTYLSTLGYGISIAEDGEAGLALATSGRHFDLILLDVMMPKLDGFDVLRRLRMHHSTPVLMLTARGDDYDRILGLELGADDYLPKPFNHRELVARIKAFFRRQELSLSAQSQQDLSVNGLFLSTATQSAQVDGTTLDLTATEFALLRLLMMNAGQRVSKQTISEQVLEKKLMAFDRSIDMHVSNLRRKVSQISPKERIKTIRGAGYLLLTQ